MPSSPEISVVVCTRDRAVSLERTLVSLADQDDDGHEVLVVDNGSTDDTAELAHRLAVTRPGWRVVSEPRPGLSVARNRGIAEAECPVVAFIDDDAEAVPGWVQSLRQRFADSEVAAVGGRVVLVFPGGRPHWVPTRLDAYYAGLDLGPEPVEMNRSVFPFGTNMAVRAETLHRVGGFDESLGRRGTDLLSDEEAELFGRVRADGGRMWWEPTATVYHHIALERATRRYLLRRAHSQGRSRARRDALESDRTRRDWARAAVAVTVASLVDNVAPVAREALVRPSGVGLVDQASRLTRRMGLATESLRLALGR